MKQLPHTYSVTVAGDPEANLTASADKLPSLEVAPPAEFGGPGDQWSPEALLMAAVANCLVLSFRAIAKASKFDWRSIECESSGVLDKVERRILFTRVDTRVRLMIPPEASAENAEKLLHKAEQSCFVSNSLSCDNVLTCEVVTDS